MSAGCSSIASSQRGFLLALGLHVAKIASPGRFPVGEPVKAGIEGDRATVRDGTRLQPDDGTPKDASTDRRAPFLGYEIEIDGGSRKQPAPAFHERSARRDIDELHVVPRSHSCAHDAMLLERPAPWRAATVGQSGFHVRLRESNLRILDLPVSPKMRTTNCAFPGPRI